MSEDKVDKLCDKIEKLVKVLMIPHLNGKTIQEQVLFLSDLGYTDPEMAELLGKTVNNISTTKSLAMKKVKEGMKGK